MDRPLAASGVSPAPSGSDSDSGPPRRTGRPLGRVGRRVAATAAVASVGAGALTLAVGGSPAGVPAAAAAGGCATPAPKARGAGSAAPVVKRVVRRAGTTTTRRPRLAATSGRAPRRLVVDDVVRCRAGAAAKRGDTVRVRYSLAVWGKRGTVETTWGRGGDVSLPLRKDALIAGWVEGIPGMRVGGRRVLVVPPGKGYGSAGAGDVPRNATLVFVIDLVGIG